jgi:hypothetical protein
MGELQEHWPISPQHCKVEVPGATGERPACMPVGTSAPLAGRLIFVLTRCRDRDVCAAASDGEHHVTGEVTPVHTSILMPWGKLGAQGEASVARMSDLGTDWYARLPASAF